MHLSPKERLGYAVLFLLVLAAFGYIGKTKSGSYEMAPPPAPLHKPVAAKPAPPQPTVAPVAQPEAAIPTSSPVSQPATEAVAGQSTTASTAESTAATSENLPAKRSGKKQPPASPLAINDATAADLQQLPGIGPATAEKIVQYRQEHGPFKSLDELRAVRGIGEKKLEKMRPYLRLE